MDSMPAEQFGRSIDRFPPARAGSGGGGSSTTLYPFDVTLEDGSPGTKDATIRPGTINSLLPSGLDTPTTLTIATVYYLILSVTTTDGAITAASIAFNTTPPDALPVQEGFPPASFDYLIGTVIEGVWYRTIGNGSLVATGSEVFRISKTSPAPGTLPYDIYYTWLLSAA